MKSLVIVLSLVLALFVTQTWAGETFNLVAPKEVTPQATGGVILSYSIVPGNQPQFVINFRWTDATGEEIGLPQSITWVGQDFTDIFGFVIRAQDVGKTIGAGLRTLIHSKIEQKYGVDIQ